MGKNNFSSKPSRKYIGGLIVVLVIGALAAGALLLFRLTPGAEDASLAAAPAAAATDAAEPITAATEPPITATGEKTEAACKASYTISADQASADRVVAAAGEKTLTNRELQILYLSQVSTFRSAGGEIAPDFSLPLDSQRCPLGERTQTWQQYFLQRAILSWQAQQAVLHAASQPQIITEEAYKPDETDNLHEKFIAPELPVNDFLYANKDHYIPNSMHQAYLDGMDATLDSLAQGAGFDDLQGLARSLGIDAEAFLRAARDYNTAYMYFTEETYALGDFSQSEQLRFLQEQWKAWLQAVPLSPDYSAAQLWVDTTLPAFSLEDTLYPDIAHQRFPEAIVYLQQDYFYYPYGDREIGKNGCGIAAFAMLATYMTDSLQTPAMMATRFEDQFFDRETHGTDGTLFVQGPEQMGFSLDKVSFDMEEVISALKNGQMVISRQEPGTFTSSGHYLLIQAYREEDDTFQVRDSNIYNYGRLAGHKTDWFQRGAILSGGAHFYIMQPKITVDPACSRCGDAGANQSYLCEKCTAALSRRNHFLTIMEDLSSI